MSQVHSVSSVASSAAFHSKRIWSSIMRALILLCLCLAASALANDQSTVNPNTLIFFFNNWSTLEFWCFRIVPKGKCFHRRGWSSRAHLVDVVLSRRLPSRLPSPRRIRMREAKFRPSCQLRALTPVGPRCGTTPNPRPRPFDPK